MYKVGDRVVRIKSTKSETDPDYLYGAKGTIIELDACEAGVDCLVSTEDTPEVLWNYEYIVSEDIFNSPLFAAMREK